MDDRLTALFEAGLDITDDVVYAIVDHAVVGQALELATVLGVSHRDLLIQYQWLITPPGVSLPTIKSLLVETMDHHKPDSDVVSMNYSSLMEAEGVEKVGDCVQAFFFNLSVAIDSTVIEETEDGGSLVRCGLTHRLECDFNQELIRRTYPD